MSRSRIDCMMDHDNVLHEGTEVPIIFVDHYMQFLGVESTITPLNHEGLFVRKLSQILAGIMIRDVNDDEIRTAMFLIGNDKAPGPNGLTFVFFKKAWDVVGNDVCKAVQFFFSNGKLLQEVNHTILTLLPKASTPSRVNDYRLISCCNVIYKCISKIITNRIKDGLDDVVSQNQSAFIPGRSISDNILLTQELMHTYHLDRGPPRCTIEIDIQKAYDTVSWSFSKDDLIGFGFHPRMVNWIMACVSSTSFSININGGLHGYFKGKRGLRHGDPMSPYLFTLVMEILTLILKSKIRKENDFTLMEALNEFKDVSRLVPSIPKSTIFFYNVLDQGTHPVKPRNGEEPMVEEQMVIVCEKASTCDFGFVFYAYLLGIAKVSWADVCLPKAERGLRIRKLETFNVALMTTHIWKLLTRNESLWAKWIHAYKLNNRNFWDVQIATNVSWGWRKLLQIHHIIRPYIWYKIGNAIANAGFFLDDKIKDVVSNGAWKWPSTWFVAYPVFISMPIPILIDDQEDILQWRKYDGSFDSFSVREAWNTIREHANEVDWFYLVWSHHFIPRHAIHVWLIMKRRLKTHDRMRQWDVGLDIDLNLFRCSLCKAQPDSHDHLFFECPYSSRVWLQVFHMVDIQFGSSKWCDIMDVLLPISKQSFLSPKGRGRWNVVREKIKNVVKISVANKEYNEDFVKGNLVTGPSCVDMNVDQNALNSSTNTLGNTFGTSNEERADIVGKESEGLKSSPTGIASSPSLSFATLAKGDTSRKSNNFRTLITQADNGVDVSISKESICAVNERLNNTMERVMEYQIGHQVGVIGERVRSDCVYSMHFLKLEEVEELLEEGILDEEVPLVDGVFEGALGALEALEMEALVDAMEV
ncbi:putative RNA-directed DNA polymerase [Tanacetum coccineum]